MASYIKKAVYVAKRCSKCNTTFYPMTKEEVRCPNCGSELYELPPKLAPSTWML